MLFTKRIIQSLFTYYLCSLFLFCIVLFSVGSVNMPCLCLYVFIVWWVVSVHIYRYMYISSCSQGHVLHLICSYSSAWWALHIYAISSMVCCPCGGCFEFEEQCPCQGHWLAVTDEEVSWLNVLLPLGATVNRTFSLCAFPLLHLALQLPLMRPNPYISCWSM